MDFESHRRHIEAFKMAMPLSKVGFYVVHHKVIMTKQQVHCFA